MVVTTRCSAQLGYRALKSLRLVDTAPSYTYLPELTDTPRDVKCCAYSPCGRWFAWALPKEVKIVNTLDGSTLAQLPLDHVLSLSFSPAGTFILTWQRISTDESGAINPNFGVWKLPDGPERDCILVRKLIQKSPTAWCLQFTEDETSCIQIVANELRLHDSDDFANVQHRLRIEGLKSFEISKTAQPSIAVFVPERKGMPACVKICALPRLDTIISQKSFFKGDKVQMKWNSKGTSLTVLAQTEVDKSGKSYYGETTLYLFCTEVGIEIRVDLDKEGPIHDVVWSPTGDVFGVVYGYMPAKTTIFDSRGKPVAHLPLAPRNTIAFCPKGKYFLVAGFGNLAGQMDIFDSSQGFKKVCFIEASNASICEWSPDGRHILTATTSPRLRVDNGIRIWHVSGSLVFTENIDELYDVLWRPQALQDFASDRVQEAVLHASALQYLQTVKPPSKPSGAYRPPGARLQPASAQSKLDGRPRMVPGASESPQANATSAGTEPLSKSAAKNKKKREAKKQNDGQAQDDKAGISDADASPPPHQNGDSNGTSNKIGKGANSAPSQDMKGAAEVKNAAHEKRVRALLKKIRAIEELKMRQAAGDQLEATQTLKIETETALRKELSQLGIHET